MTKKITIAPINGVEIENSRKAYDLIETLYEAKKLAGYNSSCELNKSLETALNEARSNFDALYTALKRRLDIWKALLCHYYKMTIHKKAEWGEYKSTSYIYPYQVLDDNSTLWLLEVRPDDDYTGGVSDKNYTLDTKFDYEVTLEEVTEEKFREQAELSTEHVINRRLKREKDKKNNKLPNMKWLTKFFNREIKFKKYPKNISWMLKDDLSPNIKNLKHCKEFHALVGVNQSSKWHKEGDVWNHTLAVSKEMFKLVSDKSWFLTDQDKKVLMVAALCHDLGKATTTYFDKKEQDWKCRNHGYASEQITRELIFDQDINTREEICWLVRWHMSFHHILQKTHSEQFQEIARLSQGFSTVEKLLILNLADSRGSKSEDNSEDKINKRLKAITELAMSNECYIKPFRCHRKSPDCNMYVMIGLPGSGKDTYIKKFLKDLPCICRDDIREEIKDGQVLGRKLTLDGQGEKAVTNIVNDRIKNCCINKKDFVINQTSLKKKYRLDFKELAFKYANVNVIYIYIEAPSVQECIDRRGGGKWNDIIKRMWSGFEFPDKSECNKMIIYKE